MPDTPRLHFTVAPIRATTAELAALGISIEAPFGNITYRLRGDILMAGIGQIVAIREHIHVIPRLRLADRQLSHLVGAAENAFFTPRAHPLGWHPSTVDGIDRWTRWIATPAENIPATALGSAIPARSDHPAPLTP